MWLPQTISVCSGLAELDQILTVLLSTEMFVGGFLAFCLDNTIPGNTLTNKNTQTYTHGHTYKHCVCVPSGSREERGLIHWRSSSSSSSSSTYDFPLGMNAIRRIRWLRRFPISPTFTGFRESDNPSTLEQEEQEEPTDINLPSTKV